MAYFLGPVHPLSCGLKSLGQYPALGSNTDSEVTTSALELLSESGVCNVTVVNTGTVVLHAGNSNSCPITVMAWSPVSLSAAADSEALGRTSEECLRPFWRFPFSPVGLVASLFSSKFSPSYLSEHLPGVNCWLLSDSPELLWIVFCVSSGISVMVDRREAVFVICGFPRMEPSALCPVHNLACDVEVASVS